MLIFYLIFSYLFFHVDGMSSGLSRKSINILAIHGKGNSASSFERKLERLISVLNYDHFRADFKFIDAPFPMDGKNNRLQWWTLPPNTRSFEATTYTGFDESSETILNELSSKKYDVILGHSQGAILLAALICSRQKEILSKCDKFILNGAAWPNPFTKELENFKIDNTFPSVKIAFVIGNNDNINPPEGARRILHFFQAGGAEVDIIEHDGEHAVPVENDTALNQIIDWITRHSYV